VVRRKKETRRRRRRRRRRRSSRSGRVDLGEWGVCLEKRSCEFLR
jgi:hypothetical protein